MLDQDPWSYEKKVDVYLFKTDEIKNLPQPLDELRRASLLADKEEMYLVLQFTDDLWSIPLRYPNRLTRLLDPEVRKMKKRLMVRRLRDTAQLYCLTQKGQRDEIIRIGINAESEKLEIESIFDSPNAKLICLEADLEDENYLFLLSDD